MTSPATHAQTVREALYEYDGYTAHDPTQPAKEPLAALDALVALAEQLQRLADDRLTLMKSEGEGWRAECDELKARAEQLQQERDTFKRDYDDVFGQLLRRHGDVHRAQAQVEQARKALELAYGAIDELCVRPGTCHPVRPRLAGHAPEPGETA